MDAQAALSLIKEIGIDRLCDFDGCVCSSFAVKGVEIDISCRKSSDPAYRGGTLIRVHSASMDATPARLESVAREVAAQIHIETHGERVSVRYCDYGDDHPMKCLYCRKPRTDVAGYLCDTHLIGRDPFGDLIAEGRDYRSVEFKIVAAQL